MRYFLIGLAAVLIFLAFGSRGPDEAPTQGAWEDPRDAAHVQEPMLVGTATDPDEPPAKADAPSEDGAEPGDEDEQGLLVDPIEVGPASLYLTFVDAETDAPIKTRFVLWRLDATGNQNYSRGDQAQASELAQAGVTVRVTGLPEGRYRVQAHAARRGSDDAPAFVVSGDRTTLQVRVVAPRRMHAYVTVFDEQGSTLSRARSARASYSDYTRYSPRPDWVAPRRLIRDRSDINLGGGSSMLYGSSSRRPVAVKGSAQGFDLGEYTEASRVRRWAHRYVLRLRARSSVKANVKTEELSAPPLVGLAVSTTWIRDRIRLPDGRLLADTEYTLTATSDAVRPTGGAGAFETAATIQIAVRVTDGKRQVGTAVLDLNSSDVLLRPGKR